jgi:ubiquinone/menaquinone biosynthesis C-methylase UbiE
VTDSYSIVTELPGIGASAEQLERLYHRYRFALDYCRDKDVLEAACGAGQGLGYIAKTAKSICGIDIDEDILAYPIEHYKGRDVRIEKMDAQELSFEDDSFDVVLLHEAIYYLPEPHKFMKECRRILRDGGIVIICSVNREWSDFHPSPYSTKYLSASELAELLRRSGFEAELFAAFSTKARGVRGKIVGFMKRTASTLHLMPKSMKGKQWLKRMFFGKLKPLPHEIEEGMTEYTPPTSIPTDSPCGEYKILYAVGGKRGK